MRIVYILCACLLIFCSSAYSQAYSERDGVGFVGGLNFSDIVGRGVRVGNEPKLGIRAGFSLETTLESSFYLRSELIYNQKGARVGTGFSQQGSVTQTFHTVELPLIGCFEFAEGIGLGGGLYTAYLIDANSEVQFGGTTTPIEFQESDFRKFEFGYAVELNFYNYTGLQGGIRYQRSISSINFSIDRYHQVISAYIGFLLNNAK
jgi:hypothetical protein